MTLMSALFFVFAGCACDKTNKTSEVKTDQAGEKSSEMAEKTSEDGSQSDDNKLEIVDVKVGNGAEVVVGKNIEVHYTGTLTDGTKFDSSRDRNDTFTFAFGTGKVIPGWDQGLVGMKVGGVRKLSIPSDLAYGPNGVPGVIPPNSRLNFEVELIKVD